ncbi:helix-turn-helix transcriptional regulator [Eggerthella sinensis]|uniref:helix-turn-helix transcriptional regulator n=1 Tax=Eggerthella sinensis TaxID=242230 RepID=UPI00248DD57C|nr:helix-turn-helix transcriptional regulator [Eggerthella sinensis]
MDAANEEAKNRLDNPFNTTINWLFLLAGTAYWGYVNLIFSYSSIHSGTAIESPDAIWFYSLFGNLLALMLTAMRPNRKEPISGNPAWITASCAFVIAGTLMVFAIHGDLLGNSLIPLAGACAGFGTGFTFVFFAEIFSKMKLQMILLHAGAQQVLGILLYLVLALLAASIVSTLAVCLITLQGFLFAKIGKALSPYDEPEDAALLSKNGVTFPVFVVAALIVGACYGLARALVIDLASEATALTPADSLGGLIGGALLIVSALLLLKKNPSEYLYQIAIPILALGLVTLPLLTSGIAAAPPILLACSSYFYGLLWLFVVLAQRDSDGSITRLASVSFFCFQAGQLAGTVLVAIIPDVASGVYAMSTIALFTVVILLVLFFSRQRKTELELLRKAERARFESGCERVTELYGLTQRESETFRMLALGVSAKQIAKRLVLSENTVKTHVRHIYQKLDIHSRAELDEVLESASNSIKQEHVTLPPRFREH